MSDIEKLYVELYDELIKPIASFTNSVCDQRELRITMYTTGDYIDGKHLDRISELAKKYNMKYILKVMSNSIVIHIL